MITSEDLDNTDDPRRLYDLASEAVKAYRVAADRMAKVRARSLAALIADGYSHKDLQGTLDISGPRISQLLGAVDAPTVEVLKAWAGLERLLAEVAGKTEAGSSVYIRAVGVLRASGRVDEDTLSGLDDLRRIRNRLVHAQLSIGPETAEEVLDAAVVINAKLVLWLQEQSTNIGESSDPQVDGGMDALISSIDADLRHDELRPEVEIEYEIAANPRTGRNQVWAILHNYSNRPYLAKIRGHWAPNAWSDLSSQRLDALGDARVHLADAESNLFTHLAIGYEADGWQLCPCNRPAEGHWTDYRAVNLNRGNRRIRRADDPRPERTPVAELWPRVERARRSGGQGSNWYVVVENTGDAPARDVLIHTDPEWPVLAGNQEETGPKVRILAPHSEVRMILAASMATPYETMATVTWVDDRGPQKNAASLRLA